MFAFLIIFLCKLYDVFFALFVDIKNPVNALHHNILIFHFIAFMNEVLIFSHPFQREKSFDMLKFVVSYCRDFLNVFS